MNFSTEQLKQQQQFMTCCSSLHFIFLKMPISITLKWEISTSYSYFFSKVLFSSLYVLRKFTFCKELVCLFYKSLLPFLTFVKNFFITFECFDIVFPQLGVIPRLGIKFIKVVAFVERCMVITRVKIKNQRSSCSEYVFL